jgi:uncharacterized protein (TIGR02118 family)
MGELHMAEDGAYRCVAVLEAPASSDIEAMQDAWRANDPFLALRDRGVTRYVRGLAMPTDEPALARRGRIGIANLWVEDADSAIALSAELRAGKVHASNPELAAARVIAMAVVERFRLGEADDYGHTPLRAVFLVKGRDDIGRHGFHQHWREIHGPLLVGQAGITRYAQQHRIDPAEDGARDFDGIAELSFPDEEGYARFGASEPHRSRQIEDLPNLFDLAVGKRFFSREELVF